MTRHAVVKALVAWQGVFAAVLWVAVTVVYARSTQCGSRPVQPRVFNPYESSSGR